MALMPKTGKKKERKKIQQEDLRYHTVYFFFSLEDTRN